MSQRSGFYPRVRADGQVGVVSNAGDAADGHDSGHGLDRPRAYSKWGKGVADMTGGWGVEADRHGQLVDVVGA